MFVVYFLKSEKDNKLYIGCTSNLEQRLSTHDRGLVASTRSRRPLKLIYKEEFDNKYEAYKKERYYKTAKGKKELKKKLLIMEDNQTLFPGRLKAGQQPLEL